MQDVIALAKAELATAQADFHADWATGRYSVMRSTVNGAAIFWGNVIIRLGGTV